MAFASHGGGSNTLDGSAASSILFSTRLYLLHYFYQLYMLAHDDHVYMISADIV
nr:hypothetical protein [Candidatus Brachybacter algidus]